MATDDEVKKEELDEDVVAADAEVKKKKKKKKKKAKAEDEGGAEGEAKPKKKKKKKKKAEDAGDDAGGDDDEAAKAAAKKAKKAAKKAKKKAEAAAAAAAADEEGGAGDDVEKSRSKMVKELSMGDLAGEAEGEGESADKKKKKKKKKKKHGSDDEADEPATPRMKIDTSKAALQPKENDDTSGITSPRWKASNADSAEDKAKKLAERRQWVADELEKRKAARDGQREASKQKSKKQARKDAPSYALGAIGAGGRPNRANSEVHRTIEQLADGIIEGLISETESKQVEALESLSALKMSFTEQLPAVVPALVVVLGAVVTNPEETKLSKLLFKAIAEVCKANIEAQLLFRKEGGFQMLVDVLNHKAHVKTSLECTSSLLSAESNSSRAYFIRGGGLTRVLALYKDKKEEMEIRLHALTILGYLVAYSGISKETLAAFEKEGVMDLLVKSLGHKKEVVVEAGAKAIAFVASTKVSSRMAFYEADIINILLKLLDERRKLLFSILKCLHAVTYPSTASASAARDLQENGGVAKLVEVYRKEKSGQAAMAAAILCNVTLAYDDNQRFLDEMNLTDDLVKVICNQKKENVLREKSAAALWGIVESNKAYTQKIEKHFEDLVAQYKASDREEFLFNIIHILRNIVVVNRAKAKVLLSKGVVDSMIESLANRATKKNNVPFERAVVEALYEASFENDPIQEKVAASVEKLTDVLTSGDLLTKRFLVMLIALVMENKELDAVAVFPPEKYGLLVPLLSVPSETTVKASLRVIKACAVANRESVDKFKDVGAVTRMVELLKHESHSIVKRAAISLTSLLNENVEMQRYCRELGCIGSLVGLLRSKRPAVSASCARCLWVIVSGDQKSRTVIRETAGLPNVVSLLDQPILVIQELGAQLIWSLAEHSREFQVDLRNANAVEKLIPLMTSERESLSVATVGALMALCVKPKNEITIELLQKKGVDATLKTLLPTDDKFKRTIINKLLKVLEK